MKAHVFPVAIFLTLTAPAFSAPVYWDGSTDLSWSNADNWNTLADQTGSPGLPGTGDVATFNAAGVAVSTISLDGDQSVSGLNALISGVSLTGGSTNSVLSLGTGGITAETGNFNIGSTTGGQNVAISLLDSQSWLYNTTLSSGGITVRNSVSLGVAGSHTLTIGGSQGSTGPQSNISGVISDGLLGGTLSITHGTTSDNVRWTLSGNNTYTGLTTVSQGGLTIGNVNALGATSAGTVVTGTASVFIRTSLGAPIAAEPISLNGAGRSSLGALRNVGGDNTWTGAITLAGSSRMGADAGSNFTLSETADIGRSGSGTRGLRIVGGGDFNINGDIGSDISFIREGGATVFAGDNKTYTGTTSISSSGTLIVNTALTGTSSVDVSGTLGGNSSIVSTSTVTVSSGGTIAPGATAATSIGNLSVGTVSFAGGSTMSLTINSGTLATDVLSVTTLNIASGTLLSLTDLGTTTLTAGQELLFINHDGNWNGGLFTVDSVEIADESTMFTSGNNTFRINYDYSGVLGNGVALVVVPEPGAVALSLLAFCAAAVRRRR